MMRFVSKAILGAVIGTAYEAASWYLNDHYPTTKLSPTPEAFHVDTNSYDIFAKLSRYKKANESAFRAALLKTDSLLMLEDALRRFPPQIVDVIRAETYESVALKNALKLVTSIKEPEDKIAAERLYKELEKFLQAHLATVRSLCQDALQ
jgi:hypothetical protein